VIKISAPKNKTISGVLEIPASKSISNRCLIIQAIAQEPITLENLSISDDTKVLQKALSLIKNNTSTNTKTIDIGIAGTAFRFLTAFLSIQKGSYILTGHQRIKERPIKPLVDALNLLGADIEYIEKEGFAPLLIKGKELINNKQIEIDSSVSSQFITALLLIAPTIKNGLNLKLKGEISSLPYITMTLSLLNHFGVESSFRENLIRIKAQIYKTNKHFIEADWSSASYFYQALALAEKGTLKLINFSKNSIQGDSELQYIFKKFGVETIFKNNSIELRKTKEITPFFEFNFSKQPDLAQTIISLCVALNIEAKLTGLQSLIIKETDRISALNNEIKKLSWELSSTNNKEYLLTKNNKNTFENELIFETYNDHRMAMCLAPVCMVFGAINILNEGVVSKSNPLFWKQIESIGFTIG